MDWDKNHKMPAIIYQIVKYLQEQVKTYSLFSKPCNVDDYNRAVNKLNWQKTLNITKLSFREFNGLPFIFAQLLKNVLKSLPTPLMPEAAYKDIPTEYDSSTRARLAMEKLKSIDENKWRTAEHVLALLASASRHTVQNYAISYAMKESFFQADEEAKMESLVSLYIAKEEQERADFESRHKRKRQVTRVRRHQQQTSAATHTR